MADAPPAPTSYYFLLKTENIQPLIDVVDQITHQIAVNSDTIRRLTQFVDEQVKFPDLELGSEVASEIEQLKAEFASHSNGASTTERGTDPEAPSLMHRISEEEVKHGSSSVDGGIGPAGDSSERKQDDPSDTLRYLLQQKYSLDEMKLTARELQELEKIPSARIRQLVSDNIKLSRIQHGNKVKNYEMAKVVQDYESLIIETILPPLRKELVELDGAGEDRTARHYLNVKYDKVGQIYSRYSANLAVLEKLTKVVELLVGYLNHEDEQYSKVYSHLVGLGRLRDQLIKLEQGR